MPIFLASLSLQAQHDYAPLWTILDGPHAQRLMDTTWLIDVTQDVLDATEALLSHCGPGDRLFLLEFVGDATWTGTGLSTDAKAWLGRRTTVSKPERRKTRNRTGPGRRKPDA